MTLEESIRIVRVAIEKLQMAGDAHLNIPAIAALETVLAGLPSVHDPGGDDPVRERPTR